MTKKYKLNVERDVDPEGEDNFILCLPYGFRFYDEIVHTKGFDTMKELRWSAKNEVVPCDCNECVSHPSEL